METKMEIKQKIVKLVKLMSLLSISFMAVYFKAYLVALMFNIV